MNSTRTSGLLLPRRVEIFAVLLREGLGHLDGRSLSGGKAAEALLLPRRRLDPGLEGSLFAVHFGDAVQCTLSC